MLDGAQKSLLDRIFISFLAVKKTKYIRKKKPVFHIYPEDISDRHNSHYRAYFVGGIEDEEGTQSVPLSAANPEPRSLERPWTRRSLNWLAVAPTQDELREGAESALPGAPAERGWASPGVSGDALELAFRVCVHNTHPHSSWPLQSLWPPRLKKGRKD